MHLQDIINLVIAYAEDQTLRKCSQAAGVGYGSTAVHWGSFYRDLFIEYYMRNIRDMKLSSQVKVNESLFGRRTKYHRSDPRGIKVWMLSLAERDTNKMKVRLYVENCL